MSEPKVINNLDDTLLWQRRMGMPFQHMIAAGMVEGADVLSYGASVRDLAQASGFVRFAFDQEVDTDLPAASTLYVVSTEAADTSTFTVVGIDAAGDPQTVTGTFAGTTPVALSGTWNHAQKLIYTDGTTQNVGTLYLSTKATAGVPGASDNICCAAEINSNYGVNPILKCPNNQTILLNSLNITTETKTLHVILGRRTLGSVLINAFDVDVTDGFVDFQFEVPMYLREGDEIRMTVASLSGTVQGASFGFNGYILRGDTGSSRTSASVQANIYE